MVKGEIAQTAMFSIPTMFQHYNQSGMWNLTNTYTCMFTDVFIADDSIIEYQKTGLNTVDFPISPFLHSNSRWELIEL